MGIWLRRSCHYTNRHQRNRLANSLNDPEDNFIPKSLKRDPTRHTILHDRSPPFLHAFHMCNLHLPALLHLTLTLTITPIFLNLLCRLAISHTLTIPLDRPSPPLSIPTPIRPSFGPSVVGAFTLRSLVPPCFHHAYPFPSFLFILPYRMFLVFLFLLPFSPCNDLVISWVCFVSMIRNDPLDRSN